MIHFTNDPPLALWLTALAFLVVTLSISILFPRWRTNDLWAILDKWQRTRRKLAAMKQRGNEFPQLNEHKENN